MILENTFCTTKKTTKGSFVSLTEVGDVVILDAIRIKEDDPTGVNRTSMLLSAEALEALGVCITDWSSYHRVIKDGRSNNE